MKICSEYSTYDEDLKKIVLAVFTELNLMISEWDAWKLWKEYSDNMACGWCDIPENKEEIVARIYSYMVLTDIDLEDCKW